MAKRQITPVVQRHKPLVVGFDSGYGAVKAVYEDQRVIFPSVAASTHHINFAADEISARYPGEQLTDSEGDWWVGNYALKQAPINERIMLQGRTNNNDAFGMSFRKRMLYAALAKLFPFQNGDVVHIYLATGLPVSDMQDAALMKETFIGRFPIRTNNANFIANIVDCAVMPQPYGTIYSQTMLPNGEQNPYYTHSKTAVFDVGTYTVDCAVDVEGEFIDHESDSAKVGVYTAQQRLRQIIESDYRDDIPLPMIDQTLRTGYFPAPDGPHDYRDDVQEALKPLRDGTLSLMNRLWKTGLTLGAIFGAGGGAPLVESIVKQSYPRAMCVKDPQTANAEGYRNYGMSVVSEQ